MEKFPPLTQSRFVAYLFWCATVWCCKHYKLLYFNFSSCLQLLNLMLQECTGKKRATCMTARPTMKRKLHYGAIKGKRAAKVGFGCSAPQKAENECPYYIEMQRSWQCAWAKCKSCQKKLNGIVKYQIQFSAAASDVQTDHEVLNWLHLTLNLVSLSTC